MTWVRSHKSPDIVVGVHLANQDLARRRALPVDTPWNGFAVPSPRLFGNNPSCEAIARSSFILSNRIHSCDYWRSQDARWFLTWCGNSADPALLWAFFSIRTPTVRAVYENLLTAAGEFKEASLFTALYNLRHAVGDDLATRCYYFFRVAVCIGSCASRSILEIAQETCPRSISGGALQITVPGHFDACWIISKAAMQVDIPMMQLCISIGARLDYRKDSLGPILRNILSMESRENQLMAEYLDLLVQGGFFLTDQPGWPSTNTGLHLCVWEIERLTSDRVIYESCPEARRRLYRLLENLTTGSKSYVSLAGVLTFAHDGPNALKAYLRCHENHSCDRDTEILERCLSEAAFLGELRTASSLLEAGVDPNVPSLSQPKYKGNRASLWNPLARAALAGNPEMLRLLLADEKFNVRSFLESVTSGARIRTPIRARRGMFTLESLLSHCRENRDQRLSLYRSQDARRSEAIDIIRTVAKKTGMDVDAHILNATFSYRGQGHGFGNVRQYPSAFWKGLCHFRSHSCRVLLIPGLVEKNIEFKIRGMDLLHLSIEKGCSLEVAQLLIQSGFEIHSSPCGTSHRTMLHSALLCHSSDRSHIVNLLLERGFDHMVDGGGMTILEASLADDAATLQRPQEYLNVFKRLFSLGAPVLIPQEYRLNPQRRCLINLLLEVNAEDAFILEVVDAGTDVNDRGGGHGRQTTPLQQAIDRGRLTLAAELIRRGADVCAPPGEDRYGHHYSALQRACATNAPLQFIQRLVEAGADVNEPPPARGPGLTSLECAARLGLLNLAQFLLDQGARVNALGSKRGCDPSTRNPVGIHQTRPLDWAACDGRLDMVSFLLESGGRSGRPGTTGLDGAIDAATVHNNHFAVAGVLQAWAAKHGSSLLEAEAAWQRTNPDLSSVLVELSDQDDVSESGDSTTSGDSDDSDGTDGPLD